jgi:GNAT superfamily N-acetyltransferase
MDGEYNPYIIRWAKKEEWRPAMMMIWKTFMAFEGKEYSAEGIRNFFEFISDDDLHRAFIAGTYQMAVALDADRIVGVASMRNGNHLSLLFVDEEYQHRGIGSHLMQYMCDYLENEAGENFMSLKAAPSAVGFYKKQGFRPVKPEEASGGIRVTAMEKAFENASKI